MNCHLNICLVKAANWYETVYWRMLCFFPFWYLCLFLSLLLKEEIPLGSQWERLVRFRLTAMASVCLIPLSMFGVCVRVVCVHAHVCITRVIISGWKSPPHLQLMRNVPQIFTAIVITMTGISRKWQPFAVPRLESSRSSVAIHNANKTFKINLALNIIHES